MTKLLDQLIPAPRLLEVNHVDLAAPPERVWDHVRHSNLARSGIVHGFFELRAIPERLAGKKKRASLLIDDLRSSPEAPGFSVLLEDERHEFAVGAIGKVFEPVIPFVYAPDAAAFLEFSEPDQVKVAWAIRVLPLGAADTRLEIEVRVDATDAGLAQVRALFPADRARVPLHSARPAQQPGGGAGHPGKSRGRPPARRR